MNQQTAVPQPMDGRDPSNLRGDAITGDRYYSREFAQKEWDHLWTKIWHIAGRTADQSPHFQTLARTSCLFPSIVSSVGGEISVKFSPRPHIL